MTNKTLKLIIAALLALYSVIFAPVWIPKVSAALAGVSLGTIVLNGLLFLACGIVLIAVAITVINMLQAILES